MCTDISKCKWKICSLGSAIMYVYQPPGLHIYLTSYLLFTFQTMRKSSLRPWHKRALRIVVITLIIFLMQWNLCIFPTLWGYNGGDMQETELLKCFQPAITAEEQETLKDLLQVVVGGFNNNNITFFIVGGTLLGSYRHHGMIPWDDDLDIYIPSAQFDRATMVLSQYKDYAYHESYFKYTFYSRNRSKLGADRSFSFPFIDLLFYSEDAKIIWETRYHWYRFPKEYKKSSIFPLTTRPFWGMTLPSPRDLLGYLGVEFDLDECQNRLFSHREQRQTSFSSRCTTSCKRLYHTHPFVFHTKTPHGGLVNESLWIGKKMISWMLVKHAV